MAKSNSIPNFLESQSEEFSNCSPASPEVTKESSGVIGGHEGKTLISFPSLVVNYSFDTLHINYHVEYGDSELFPELKELKTSIQAGIDSELPVDFFKSGLFSWNLQRTGNKFFPYVLRTGDLSIGISTRSSDAGIPNLCLMIGSLSCNQDLKSLLKQFKNWLKMLKIKVIIEKVSRFDICSDILWNLQKSHTDKITRYITKARDMAVFYSHRKFAGIQIGKGKIVARIYNKQMEMKNKVAYEKQMYFNSLWKTSVDDDVTRVEFQLRRAAIVELLGDITTVKELFKKIDSIWEYLTQDWLKHCHGFVDRENKNQSRAVSSEFWKVVCSANGKEIVAAERIRKQKHINVPALMKQVRGIMLSVSAGLGHYWEDKQGIISTIMDLVHTEVCEYFPDPGFEHAFVAKQTRAVVSF